MAPDNPVPILAPPSSAATFNAKYEGEWSGSRVVFPNGFKNNKYTIEPGTWLPLRYSTDQGISVGFTYTIGPDKSGVATIILYLKDRKEGDTCAPGRILVQITGQSLFANVQAMPLHPVEVAFEWCEDDKTLLKYIKDIRDKKGSLALVSASATRLLACLEAWGVEIGA